MISRPTLRERNVNAELIGPTPMSMPVTPERAVARAMNSENSEDSMDSMNSKTCMNMTCEVDRVATSAVASDHVTRDDEATRTRATSMRSDSSVVRPDTSVAK
jgi:hypothetical protein